MRRDRGDVVIVGAGVIGLFVAYFLARAGRSVTLVERQLPGAGSSTRNGGGIRAQFGTATNVRLGLLSEPSWSTYENDFGVDIQRRQIGYLFLAHDTAALAELRDQVDLQRGLGVASELLNANEVVSRWRSLAPMEVAGASFGPADGFVNQHRVIEGLTQTVRSLGVEIQVGTDVTALTTRAGMVIGLETTVGPIRADTVVNCAGAWAAALASTAGVELPIRSRRVQLMIARPSEALPAGLPWLIDQRDQIHVRHDLDGRVQVGGFLGRDETVDPVDFDHDADPSWIDMVRELVAARFGVDIPRANIVRSWAGLYPSTPDQHPIIDRAPNGMVVVGGFAGLGLMHAPAAGLLAAELIADGRITSIDAHELGLSRFAGVAQPIERTGF